MSAPQILEIIQTVKAIEKAKTRITFDTKQTFYSKKDLWYYFTVPTDDRVCTECQSYDNKIFFGIGLRSTFPWHEVVSDNLIMPKVHPNCRCIAVRAVDVPLEFEEISEE